MAKRVEVEQEFERIAEYALAAAARVNASVVQYRDGLRTLIEMANAALQASDEMDGDDEEDA